MEELPKNSIEIDVGGDAGFLLKKALENPDKKYIVLQPAAISIPDQPENLSVIQWASERDNEMPIEKGSVDEANANFLMGEIVWKDHHNIDSYEESFEKYRKLISDVKSALKENGVFHVTDVKECIGHIVDLLREQGFDVTRGPVRVPDEAKTIWTKTFFSVFKGSGRAEEESGVLPMEVDAVKRG